MCGRQEEAHALPDQIVVHGRTPHVRRYGPGLLAFLALGLFALSALCFLGLLLLLP